MLDKIKPNPTAAERRFYHRLRAFGRFGMRIFKPVVMDTPHWHGHVEINYVRNARMHYIVDGAKLTIEPDRPVSFWAGVPHQLMSVERINDFEPELANIYLPLDAFLYMKHIPALQMALLTGAMIEIHEDVMPWQAMQRWYNDYRSGEAERADILKTEIHGMFRRASLGPITYLKKSWLENAEAEGLASSNVRHVIAMLRYILENLEKPLRISDVTAVTGLHSHYALTLFSKTIRLPLKQFIIRMRLIQARGLLMESDLAITSIATQSGFNSISQFYAHFGKAYGMSPQQLRHSYLSGTA